MKKPFSSTFLSRYHDVGVLILWLAFGFQLVRVSYDHALFNPTAKIPEFVKYLV